MSKVMGIYVNFTKTTHQIWSCHVNQASNFEIFCFLPNFVLNFEKVTQEQKSYKQKTNWGWKPPSAYRVKTPVAQTRLIKVKSPLGGKIFQFSSVNVCIGTSIS